MAIFPISYLRDDFENNVVDPAWQAVALGSATAAETGGQAVLTLPSSVAGTHTAYYFANAQYDLTGDQCAIGIGTMVATGVAAIAAFQLYLDASNIYKWVQSAGTLKAQKIVAGVTTDLFSVAWSATTHKYLRIRESGGTVFFDTSTSASAGAVWTNRASTTIASAFAVTDLYVQFFAQCGNIASPGSFRLDMFNLVLPTPSRTWRWTDANWPEVNRHRSYTLASGGNKQGVIVTADSRDASDVLGGTVRYFAGPVGSSSGGFAQLTEYSTLVAAQANPFTIPTDGRVDLPAVVQCLYHRLYHSSDDGASGTLREYVPRRLVQADDVEAESIKALHISVLDLDASHYITAGAGTVTLDDAGITLTAPVPASLADLNKVKWLSGTVDAFDIYATYSGGSANANISARAPSTAGAVLDLTAFGDVNNADIQLTGGSSGGNASIVLTAAQVSVFGGLSVGFGAGAASSGQISTLGSVGLANAALPNVRLYIKAQDATASNYAIYMDDSASALLFYVRDDGVANLKGNFFINGTQSLTTRRTGWGAPTGTPTRSTFATGSVTLSVLAEHVKALIDDLTTHGLIGA